MAGTHRADVLCPAAPPWPRASSLLAPLCLTTPRASLRDRRERVGSVYSAGEAFIRCLRLAGAPPRRHGRRSRCCRASPGQPVTADDARGRDECVGVFPVARDLSASELSPVNGGVYCSQRGSTVC